MALTMFIVAGNGSLDLPIRGERRRKGFSAKRTANYVFLENTDTDQVGSQYIFEGLVRIGLAWLEFIPSPILYESMICALKHGFAVQAIRIPNWAELAPGGMDFEENDHGWELLDGNSLNLLGNLISNHLCLENDKILSTSLTVALKTENCFAFRH